MGFMVANNFYRGIKRILEFLISGFAILALIPVFLLISIAIKIDSKGPILYTQLRQTKAGKQFMIFKFRSMLKSARQLQHKGKPTKSVITPLGRFLRDSLLDELPQLWNVFKG